MTQAANVGFDIGTLDAIAEVTFEVAVILDIDGNPKSGFNIVGKNSKEYKDTAHRLRVEGLVRSSKRKSAMDMSTNEGADSMAKTIEANDVALVASVVTGWFGFSSNGVAATFDPVVVKQMLTKFPTWRQKVLEALENDANFMKG